MDTHGYTYILFHTLVALDINGYMQAIMATHMATHMAKYTHKPNVIIINMSIFLEILWRVECFVISIGRQPHSECLITPDSQC